jgi:hypothetical protein
MYIAYYLSIESKWEDAYKTKLEGKDKWKKEEKEGKRRGNQFIILFTRFESHLLEHVPAQSMWTRFLGDDTLEILVSESPCSYERRRVIVWEVPYLLVCQMIGMQGCSNESPIRLQFIQFISTESNC